MLYLRLLGSTHQAVVSHIEITLPEENYDSMIKKYRSSSYAGMGQITIGILYIRCRRRSMTTTAE